MRESPSLPPDADVAPALLSQGLGSDAGASSRGESAASVVRGEWEGVRAELRTHRTDSPLHWDDRAYEVVVLIRGSVITSHSNSIDGHAIHGMAWPSSPDNPQGLLVRPQPGTQMLHIVLDAALVKSAQDQSGPIVRGARGFAGCHDQLIEQIAREFMREMSNESYCGRLLIESLARALALRLLQLQASATTCMPLLTQRVTPRAEQRMRRVFEFIENRRDKSPVIAELAAIAWMSPFHFSRTFKKLTGFSPIHYINNRRIDLAKEMLTKTDRKLLDIAQACQFITYSGFSRAFRRLTGVTPADYRSRTAPA